MSKKEEDARKKLDLLSEALAREIDKLTDEELLAEAENNGENVETVAERASSLIELAIAEVGKKKMAAARATFEKRQHRGITRLHGWSFARKRALIDDFAQNDNELHAKLTLAARHGKDTEADVDSFIEDLIDLGVIDEEGNTK